MSESLSDEMLELLEAIEQVKRKAEACGGALTEYPVLQRGVERLVMAADELPRP